MEAHALSQAGAQKQDLNRRAGLISIKECCAFPPHHANIG